MRIPSNSTLKELAEITGCEFKGPENHVVTGLNEIHKVEKGDLTFVDVPKYYKKALTSAATTILINDKNIEPPAGKALIISDDPFRDYNRLVKHFHKGDVPAPGHFVKGENVRIGENTVIFPGVYIGNNVTIGSGTVIHPNTVIYSNTQIGDQVIIHANCTIGADAFYFKKRPSGYDKLLSCGRVIINDHVEIGAGTTIDKGVSGDTIIGTGTKIDDQVHIGHGVVTGKDCLIVAQVGIGGKTTLQDNVTLWAKAGVNKDLVIEDNVTVLASGMVGDNLEKGKTYFGVPATEKKEAFRSTIAFKKLPDTIRELRERILKLEKSNGK